MLLSTKNRLKARTIENAIALTCPAYTAPELSAGKKIEKKFTFLKRRRKTVHL